MATINKGLNLPAYDAPNWDVPLNQNFNYIDASLGTTTAISVAGVPVTPVVLTDTQMRSLSFAFSGLLGNNVNYRIPSGVGGNWTVYNSTTGAYTLTISSGGGGTSIIIPQGESRAVLSDGTNIKLEDIYGGINQVLFNSGTNISGDVNFTYASGVLSTAKLRAGDGTTALPAISPTTATTTGISFPAVNEMAISTNAIQRVRWNAAGALSLGAFTSYGTAGMVMKSSGNTGSPIWGYAGASTIATLAASGTVVTFSGLNLDLYSIVIVVMSSVTHNSGGDRAVVFSPSDVQVTSANAGATAMNGMIVMHTATGIGFATTGRVLGGGAWSTGFSTSYTTSSTTLRLALSGSGSFSGGNFILLGIS